MRKMKDNGIEWIGEIPEDWKIIPLKFLASHNDDVLSENTPDDLEFDYIDISSVQYGSGIINKQHITFGNAPSRARRIVRNNDVIISTVRTYLKAVAIIPDISKLTVASTGFACLRTNEKISPKFLYYSVLSDAFVSTVEAYSVGISYPAINASQLVCLKLPLPSIEEQSQIANFLDEKCAVIDRLVERHQEVIEKLKAYRQSVISEAVTRGLDPDAPMKDSGIAICSTIPVEWNISRIKYLFKLREERNYQPLDKVKLLSLYTDIGVFPHGEQEERGNKAVTAEGYKIVYKNDIVVNIILAWMGAIGISSYDGVTSPAYDIYMPIKNINPTYFHYLFRTKAFSGECYKYGRGIMAMRWRTYSTEFKSIKVPLPPIEVQNDIVSFLNKKIEDIENIIQKKLTVISKLAEYKKSIIYEYVTGKKEVPAS